MDDRVRRHAEVLVDHCLDVEAGDHVLLRAPAAAEDLVVALYELLGERGAHPFCSWQHGRAVAAYGRAVDVEDLTTPEHERALMAATDAVVLVRGATNRAETTDIAPEKSAARGRARKPILEERLDARWVMTQHPTPADAQRAGMGTDAWADFVYDAVNRDWAAQREFQAQLVDLLDPASEVRVVAGDGTDLRLSVDGMDAGNDYGLRNMPGGEVYTVPAVDGVAGRLHVDLPFVESGREVHDARLEFEDGEVVALSADRNEDALRGVVETDEGSRRVGELGVGMNRGIDRFTGSMLFDEKMGDTVHVALGDALEDCVPEDRERNESGRHVDMLVDVSEDSFIEVDGEVVQRDGSFVFEESEA